MKTKKLRKKNNAPLEPKRYNLSIAIFPFLCLLLIGLIKGTHFYSSSIMAFTILILIVIDIVAFALLFIFASKEPDNPAIPQFYIFYFIGICLQLILVVGMANLSLVTYHQKVFKTLLLFIFNLILLGVFISYYLRNKESIRKKQGFLLFFLLYFLYIFIQFVVSFFTKAITYDAPYYLANYSFLIIFSLFFYLYLKDLHDIKILLLLFQFFILVVFIWSTVDLVNMVVEADAGGRTLSVATVIMNLRPKLSFGNTNYFAGYLIGFLPLISTAPYLLTTPDNTSIDDSVMIKNKIFKYVIIVLSIIIIFPLFLTQTTASFLGFYVGFVFLALSMIVIFKKKQKMLFLCLGVLALIVMPAIQCLYAPDIVEPIMPRLAFKLKNLNFAIYDRMNGWIGGLELFKEYPVFGAGLGAVYAASFKYSDKFYYIYSDSNSFKHSHSEFVEILGEAGIVGITFFTLLVGFVIVSLIRNAFFNKSVSRHYKVIALAVTAGIISMLVQQLFSLTLRMSVTMTAFFSLLGIGVFLIFFAGNAVKKDEEQTQSQNNWLRSFIPIKGYYIIFSVVAAALLGSLFLYLPLFRSENMIIRSFLNPQPQMRDYYLTRAVTIMPGNPYAWSEKYRADFRNLQSLLQGVKVNRVDDEAARRVEQQFALLEKNLVTLNNIIPGYQNMAGKYVQFNMIKTQYYYQISNRTNNMDFYYKYLDTLPVLFDYFDDAINYNFLDRDNHINKLLFLSLTQKRGQVFTSAVSDYVRASLYFIYCRHRLRIKDNFSINMSGDQNKLTKEGDKLTATVSASLITELEQSIYGVYQFDVVKKKLQERMNRLIKELDATLEP